MMQVTYLTTGGEEFIGRNIKQYLGKNNCNAVTLDIDGKPDYMISVTDFHSLMDIDEKFDGIFHLAATTSATHGNSESMSREEIIPRTYSNLYPITKIVDEYRARYYSVRREVECISLPYFNTYGIGENSKAQYASVVW